MQRRIDLLHEHSQFLPSPITIHLNATVPDNIHPLKHGVIRGHVQFLSLLELLFGKVEISVGILGVLYFAVFCFKFIQIEWCPILHKLESLEHFIHSWWESQLSDSVVWLIFEAELVLKDVR